MVEVEEVLVANVLRHRAEALRLIGKLLRVDDCKRMRKGRRVERGSVEIDVLFARRSCLNIPFCSKMVPGGNLGSAVSTPYFVQTVTGGEGLEECIQKQAGSSENKKDTSKE